MKLSLHLFALVGLIVSAMLVVTACGGEEAAVGRRVPERAEFHV